jgi:class 3 adenylate cyclase
MPDDKVDDLVTRFLQAEDDLATLGKRVEGSGQELAVVFVDLVASTELKHKVTVPRWLGYVIRFLKATADLALANKGTVVKRIGDEIMLTFPTAPAADGFMASVEKHDTLRHYRLKASADWGVMYPVAFPDANSLDPYGPVVDRAARIAHLATAGTTLASKEFVNALPKDHVYQRLGTFPLKGIPQEQEVFMRGGEFAARRQYIDAILRTLNDERALLPRFRFSARKFTLADFAPPERLHGHPFLVRELLNLPLMHHTFESFWRLLQSKEGEARELIGHIVEWDARVESVAFGDHCTLSIIGKSGRAMAEAATVMCPREMTDVLRQLKAGDQIRLRAVLVSINGPMATLDYADVQQLA